MTHSIDQAIAHTLQKGTVCHIVESQPSQPSLCKKVQTQMCRRGYRNIVIKTCEITDRLQIEQLWETCLIKILWEHLNTHDQSDHRDRKHDKSYASSHSGRLEWLSRWLATTQQLSPTQRLARFASELLLNELCEQPVIIFIEQIEQLLSVPNAIETLFHWIDYCTELRETYLTYHHINFALFSRDPLTKLAFRPLRLNSDRRIFPQQYCTLAHAADRSVNRPVDHPANHPANHRVDQLATLPLKLPSIWPFPRCAQPPETRSKARPYAQHIQHKRQPNILSLEMLCHAVSAHSSLIPCTAVPVA
ncbi:MAG: hypothetical protein AAFR58_05750 [Cyanobacteria bacterium J06627_28]